MKNKPIFILQILAGAYWVLYFLGFFEFNLRDVVWDAEQITIHLMILLFSIGFAFSFFKPQISGVIFQIWHFLIWVLSLTIWPDAGMVLILAAPVLPLGVFFFYHGYKEVAISPPPLKKKWNLILQLLFVNYTVISILGLFAAPNRPEGIDFISMPFVFIPIFTIALLVLFILSWRNKVITGILLIIWYVLAGVVAFLYPEIPNQEGPILMFGFPILIQGILYVNYYIKFEK